MVEGSLGIRAVSPRVVRAVVARKITTRTATGLAPIPGNVRGTIDLPVPVWAQHVPAWPSLVIVASSGPVAVRRERRWGTVAAGPGLDKPGPGLWPFGARDVGDGGHPEAATSARRPRRAHPGSAARPLVRPRCPAFPHERGAG